MEHADKQFFKNLLIKQKEDLSGTLKKMDDHGIGSSEELQMGELSFYDNHPADFGTELFNLGMNKNLRNNQIYQMNEIDKALAKLEDNNFGMCEVCSKQIDKERLEARPQARLCIECAKSRNVDMEYLQRERPVEEKVLMSFFYQGYPDENDGNQFEGLDQWNDLMNYGSSSTPQDMGQSSEDSREIHIQQTEGANITDSVQDSKNRQKEYKEFYTNKVDLQGIVDPIDNISNEEYKKQLPD